MSLLLKYEWANRQYTYSMLFLSLLLKRQFHWGGNLKNDSKIFNRWCLGQIVVSIVKHIKS